MLEILGMQIDQFEVKKLGAQTPDYKVLEGIHVRLEPLNPEKHRALLEKHYS